MSGKIISVNVGMPRLAMWRGATVSTAIFKKPVKGRVMLRRLNLDGDRQSDLSVHGGPEKAVYVYPSEHYDFWRKELPAMELPWGMFGENLTTEGLSEETVHIGDRFRVGQAELTVTQPRMPCHKLAVKFQRADILRKFLASGLTGFYFSVQKEAEIEAGDRLELIEREGHAVKVSDITRIYAKDKGDFETMRRALEVAALPEAWREFFREMVPKLSGP
ncbi:MAG TPA: MOSC domain-containing protein [Pyrinomonadaceae bacterium]|nr:MOSC domain-containing protein [Pyrinomonadaceae bacterium]